MYEKVHIRGSSMKATIYIDGASRGNPGPAACAAIVIAEGYEERGYGLFLGETTNNVAEYAALILGLQEAEELGVDEISVFSDSDLCVKQIRGEFKVSSPNLAPLHKKALRLLRRFSRWEINHIPREDNARADSLANRVLDLHNIVCGETN
jgi:ribonuclease HI